MNLEDVVNELNFDLDELRLVLSYRLSKTLDDITAIKAAKPYVGQKEELRKHEAKYTMTYRSLVVVEDEIAMFWKDAAMEEAND
jgi:hypothetical protein